MSSKSNNRRNFLKSSLAAGAVVSSMGSARSYARVIGANDRIHIGMIGTGGRGRWHIGWLHRISESENVEIMAVCDIWDVNRGHGEAEVQKRFENNPKLYKNYRRMLDDKDIDAVVIATPDHQHCPMLADAVRAGKDAYVEKPIAVTLDELIEANDVVKASKQIVQNGSQGRSSAGAAAAKEFYQSGKIGKLLRVEESRSHYIPYWNHYPCPKSEAETDWQAFLFNRPYRPFNPDQHGCWMGYRDFTSGTVGGWMSHLSDFVHFITDCGFPKTATAQGGIYSPTSDPRRTCPD
ncbi:MAG: Gfo/Idh/MocA family oxidoreductase, partial [Candidatus Hinthialibacter sp.]